MTKTTKTPVRREKGEGTVFYNTARDRWTSVLDLGTDAQGKRKRKTFTGKKRADVVKALREAKRQHEDGKPLVAALDTVSSLLADFLVKGIPASARSANTRAGYTWAIEKHIVPAIGAVRLRDLTPDHVDEMLRGMRDAGLGQRSLGQIHRVLTVALRWAERRGRIARNVSALCDTPTDGARRPSRAFTGDEIRALVRVAGQCDDEAVKRSGSSGNGTRLEAAWLLMITFGLRPGECFGLTWADVDFDAAHYEGDGTGVLTVSGSLVRDQGSNSLYVGPTKTATSRRRADMPPAVVDALRAHRKYQREMRLSAGSDWRIGLPEDTPDLVFTNGTGGPLDPSAVRRRFKRLCVAAGLSDDRHPHELRHTNVTLRIEILNEPAERVSRSVGHSDIRTTLAHYNHAARSSEPISAGMAALVTRSTG